MCWDQSWWPETPPCASVSPSEMCVCRMGRLLCSPWHQKPAQGWKPLLGGCWELVFSDNLAMQSASAAVPLPHLLALHGGSALLAMGLCSLPDPAAHAGQLASNHSSSKMKASSNRYFPLLFPACPALIVLRAGLNNTHLARTPKSALFSWWVHARRGGPSLPGGYRCLHLPPPPVLSVGLGGDFPDPLGPALSIPASLLISGPLCSTERICFCPEQIPGQSQTSEDLSS